MSTVLFTREDIEAMVERVAEEIVQDHKGEEIVLIIILKGAAWFGADLSRALERRLNNSHKIFEEFMRVSSYGDGRESSGDVRIETDIQQPIVGKRVVVVDDVADTQLTLAAIVRHLTNKQPLSLRVCVAVEKVCPKRQASVQLHYVGFKEVRGFLAGYGMDDKGACRGWHCIVRLDDDEHPAS